MNKLLHFIGIAYRAGRVQKGAFLSEKAIKDGSARLVLIALDASENTKDKFASMCQYYDVVCFLAETKEMLGKVTGGADMRSVIALTDDGFAKRTEELLRLGQMEQLGRSEI